MNPLAPFFDATGFVILDGGLASELERRGADIRDPLWSAKLLIDGPDLIRQVHEDYFRAGADVCTSASYQASLLGFVRRGLAPRQAIDLIKLSVRLVREARDRFWSEGPIGRLRPIIAASVGCYGATLGDGAEYHGRYDLDADDLIDWHRPRIETLLDESLDLLACETIPCLAEAVALAKLLTEIKAPAWVSFCCQDGETLSSGEPFAEAVQMMDALPSLVAVGVNCTAPGDVESLIAIARRNTSKPILAYPNRGGVWNASTKTWDMPAAPLDWGQAGLSWRTAGATLLGGCCRTTPDDIRRLRAALHPS